VNRKGISPNLELPNVTGAIICITTRPIALRRRLRAASLRFTRFEAVKTLVVSLVLSILDYGSLSLLNETLAGTPAYLLRRLQSVLYAAARVISGLLHSAHTTSTTLSNMHWLRAADRIKFQLATPTFRCLQG